MDLVYALLMLRPVDIAVLLKLSLPGAAGLSFQRLASDLHLSSSEVHGSFKRARLSGLLAHDGAKSVNRSALLEFLDHGLRYAFPAERGELTRGVPTAYAAEPLKSALQESSDDPPVWPFVEGKVRGHSFAPLYKHAATAALRDPKLYELLGLADALRDGRIRERKIAMDELGKRILHHA
jgi:hypothetical protein